MEIDSLNRLRELVVENRGVRLNCFDLSLEYLVIKNVVKTGCNAIWPVGVSGECPKYGWAGIAQVRSISDIQLLCPPP